jgi:putative FmdB family regulatory protein
LLLRDQNIVRVLQAVLRQLRHNDATARLERQALSVSVGFLGIMPVYGYKCSSCGFEEDIIQKMSDKPLTKCPKCGKDTFVKQLSAPGFELKGKGWAATDFNAGHTGVAAAHTKNK